MKNWFTLSLIALCFFLTAENMAMAEPSAVPHFLNYQSLLYDDGGNLISDGPADVTFKITDADGKVLFEEDQTLDVVNGAVSAIVGNGLDAKGAPSGGLSDAMFSPDKPHYLEVTVEGFPPETSLEIVSVPYSIYAETALHVADESVTSTALAKKSVTIEHLADGLIEEIASQLATGETIASKTDLTNLQTTYRSTTGAGSIGVNGGFVYSGSNNLQGVLQDLDRAIQHRQAAIDTAQKNTTDETNARISADTILQTNISNEITARSSADSTLQTKINNEATVRSSSDNTLQTNISSEASARSNADTAHAGANIAAAHSKGSFPISRLDTDIATQTELNIHASATSGVHGVSGYVVGTTNAQTLSNKTYKGTLSDTDGNHSGTWQTNDPSAFASSGHNHNSTYVNITGDTMTGVLHMSDKRITDVGAPIADHDAVRKIDLDNEITARALADENQAMASTATDQDHEDRLSGLEARLYPKAWGTVRICDGDPDNYDGRNITVAKVDGAGCKITFASPPPNAGYAIVLTLMDGNPDHPSSSYSISTKEAGYFIVNDGWSGNPPLSVFDFIVIW